MLIQNSQNGKFPKWQISKSGLKMKFLLQIGHILE